MYITPKAYVERQLEQVSQKIKEAEKKLIIHSTFQTERIKDLKKEESIYRLINDIRLGKIIPVVAENGTIASVTFS